LTIEQARPMFPHDPGRTTAGIPLQTHVQELRGRCEAIARVQGGATDYWQEIGIFRDYALKNDLCRSNLPEEIANRPPDEEGNEHQVWFNRNLMSVLKVTWPGFFGLLVAYRADEEFRASPIAYLERWNLHNELFGDSVSFVGVVENDNLLRLVIEQPAITGQPATTEDILEFFTLHGWQRLSIQGELAFFDPNRNVVISDTHRGNIIKMDDGLLAPIDLRVQPLSGAMLESITKACGM